MFTCCWRVALCSEICIRKIKLGIPLCFECTFMRSSRNMGHIHVCFNRWCLIGLTGFYLFCDQLFEDMSERFCTTAAHVLVISERSV